MKLSCYKMALLLTLQASLILPFTALRAETAPKPEAETVVIIDDQPTCEKPVKARGPGNTISSIAELKAIIIWTQLVSQKYGADLSEWHFAKAKSVKCTKDNGSNYFYCSLSAIPCAYKKTVVQTETPPPGEKQGEKDSPSKTKLEKAEALAKEVLAKEDSSNPTEIKPSKNRVRADN